LIQNSETELDSLSQSKNRKNLTTTSPTMHRGDVTTTAHAHRDIFRTVLKPVSQRTSMGPQYDSK